MKKRIGLWLLLGALSASAGEDPVGAAAQAYFDRLFAQLGAVAAQQPNHDTFRAAMKPVAESVDGFFGGTLLSSDFVIEQSYYKIHAMANGYDLKKVRELDVFRELMRTAPGPQLSEPGHGSLLQPRLIAMRFPFFENGEVRGIVSMMVRTEQFLAATGLDQCRAFRITCRGAVAEEKGRLSDHPVQVRLALPSTDWLIEYDR
jgi:hypothetical protein